MLSCLIDIDKPWHTHILRTALCCESFLSWPPAHCKGYHRYYVADRYTLTNVRQQGDVSPWPTLYLLLISSATSIIRSWQEPPSYVQTVYGNRRPGGYRSRDFVVHRHGNQCCCLEWEPTSICRRPCSLSPPLGQCSIFLEIDPENSQFGNEIGGAEESAVEFLENEFRPRRNFGHSSNCDLGDCCGFSFPSLRGVLGERFRNPVSIVTL